jgi:AcrR family transcriptional regulator
MPRGSHRDRLIQGAIECLQTKGFAHTTARDIAAAANANLASIGYHFGSKDALLNAALIEVFKERDALIGARVRDGEDASAFGLLHASFTAVRSVLEDYRPILVASIEAIAQAERSPELRRELAAYYRQARSGIAEAMRAALGTEADRLTEPEVLAGVMVAAFDGLAIQWVIDPDTAPEPDQVVTALIEWVALVVADRSTTAAARPAD